MFEKLKGALDYIKGKKPTLVEYSNEDTLPYLSAEYLRNNKLESYVDKKNIDSKYHCNSDDLLIIWDGSNSGEVFMGKPGILSSTMAKLNIKDKKYTNKYLYYFLKQKFSILNEKVTGAAIPHLNRAVLENLEIYSATQSEQQEIVQVLDTMSDIIRLREECISHAQDLIPALFQKMFDNPQTNRKNLNKVKVGKILTLSSGKFLPAKEMDENGIYSVYGGNGINGHHNKYLFEEPQLCIGRVGVKCGCVHLTEPKSWITDNALYINKLLKSLNMIYLKEALTQINLNQYAKRAAQPVISQSTIYNQYILEPPIELQELFAQKAIEIESYIKEQQEELKNAKQMFQSLLHHAFTGELTRHKFGGDANG